MSTLHLVKCVCHGYTFLGGFHDGLQSPIDFQGDASVIDLERIHESGSQQTPMDFSNVLYPPGDPSSSVMLHPSQPIHPPSLQLQPGCGCGLCGGLEVPQRPYHPARISSDVCHQDGETLSFSKGGCGIRVLDAVENRLSGLVGGDDLVFVDTGVSTFSVRIEWPGYRMWTAKFRVKNWGGTKGPVTRARLVSQLGKRTAEFIETMEDVVCTDLAWKVGSKDIKVDSLVLVSLTRVSKGSWQPLLRLLA